MRFVGNDPCVVPFRLNVALIAKKLSHSTGVQSAGSAPHFIRFSLTTNLNHFYPVAERSDSCVNPAGGIDLVAAGIRSTEYGYTKIRTT